MEKLQPNKSRSEVRREPLWFSGVPAAKAPVDIGDLPHRLIEAQYAADLAAPSPGHDPTAHRQGRIEAVRAVEIAASQTHALDMEMLVRDALRAFHFGAAPGISVGGQLLLVRPPAAILLALMLQEWTTNSIKFGMLTGGASRPALEIQWTRTKENVELTWRERGIAIVQAADTRRNGFGRTLVERVFPEHLATQSRFSLLPGGVDCTLILPNSIAID